MTALAGRLGHRFRDEAGLWRAVTHPSYAHEHPPARSNEALAFLGDAVIDLLVAERLHAASPEGGPGPLTERRAALVSGPSLAAWAARLGLPECLRLGRGEDQDGGRAKESVLATALEAVVAALYLDGGLPAARRVVDRLMDGSGGHC